MTILQPGEFRVADYRKSIPASAKILAVLNAVRLRAFARAKNGVIDPGPLDDVLCALCAPLHFDHRPPLCDRPYDTEAGDFKPPQNDPNYLEVVTKPHHDERTFGRVAGAAKTVSTRSSDVGERSRTADLQVSTGRHRAAMERKAGRHEEADAITAQLRTKRKHTRPKSKIVGQSKIAQRETPWPKRKFRT